MLNSGEYLREREVCKGTNMRTESCRGRLSLLTPVIRTRRLRLCNSQNGVAATGDDSLIHSSSFIHFLLPLVLFKVAGSRTCLGNNSHKAQNILRAITVFMSIVV